jgi:hypothetical protein
MAIPSCKVCQHPEKTEIDSLIARETPQKAIVSQFSGISASGLSRHARRCDLPAGAAGESSAISPAQEISALRRLQKSLLRKKNVAAALSVSREMRAWLNLQTKNKATLEIPTAPPAAGSAAEVRERAQVLAMARSIVEVWVQAGGADVAEWVEMIGAWVPQRNFESEELGDKKT